MLTNPISGKILHSKYSKDLLFKVVNNYFPNKYKPLPVSIQKQNIHYFRNIYLLKKK